MRNKILKGFTYFMFLQMLFCSCMLDSEDWVVPAVLAFIGAAWCILFCYANYDYLEEEEWKND